MFLFKIEKPSVVSIPFLLHVRTLILISNRAPWSLIPPSPQGKSNISSFPHGASPPHISSLPCPSSSSPKTRRISSLGRKGRRKGGKKREGISHFPFTNKKKKRRHLLLPRHQSLVPQPPRYRVSSPFNIFVISKGKCMWDGNHSVISHPQLLPYH